MANHRRHGPAVPQQDPRLVRTDDDWLHLPNRWGIPVDICAGTDVPIESGAVDEILTVLETADTLERLGAVTGHTGAEIDRVVLTPDVHKGAGIPIGTVLQTRGVLIPQAVGNDVNCGMRLETTSLTVDRVRPRLDALERRLRHLFFEGGRRIALSGVQREALLREGLPGLLGAGAPSAPGAPQADGVWRALRPGDAAPGRIHGAHCPAATADAFRDWIHSAGGTSYDSVIGSVGGGNHFAELQYVSAVHDRQAAYAWGFGLGQVVLMVHSGSLSLGQRANAVGLERARAAWPGGVPLPGNRIIPIMPGERSEPARRRYLDAFGNAANFAVGNRFFLALMMRAGLAAECGELDGELVYDAPHNLLWRYGDERVVHRKGATPAGGYAEAEGGPYAMWGEPVIVPGSMGAASYVMRGRGNPRTLASACHGAGRRVRRGAAVRASDAALDAFLREFRVVTPLDHRDPAVARRSDVMAAWRRDLKQEAPWVYKDIGPVVSSLSRAGVADPVVELRPLLTVKG
ncbi:RNA-splicing ligase RtcB [Planobispora rosea]|uniref:tRNA-splicing ligase RtcB n=1 Tax=Planobispora rosea TaxID=35762 RepID=A0A8J3WCD2_PLARO|nr:RtcB family protein [Planobispora rosea]GGS48812.1 RNA-splicing ligase RtcB [Planobispora rosea]GIH83717.1 RNA-splicing ligase RtcB [Planobispora rosea]